MQKKISLILIIALCAHSVLAISDAELDSLYNQFQITEVEVTARALTKDVIVPQLHRGKELCYTSWA